MYTERSGDDDRGEAHGERADDLLPDRGAAGGAEAGADEGHEEGRAEVMAASVPSVEQKAADLVPNIERVAPRAWWVPSWSGAADEHGDAFHVVTAHKGADGAWAFACDCPAAAHGKACCHVAA